MGVLKGVAWADIVMSALLNVLPLVVISVAVGLIIGVVIYRCRFRR